MKSRRAADALSDRVICVQDDARPADVQAIAQERQSTHAAIFDGNRFRGVVALDKIAFSHPERIFADLFDRFSEPLAVSPETPLDDVARIFEQERRDDVVVQEADGEYVGTITQQSLLRVLLEWTREKSVEEETRAEERFHSLLEAAPDAMLIVDQDGSVVQANTNAEKLFRCERNGLNGVRVESLIPKALRDRHVEHRKQYAVNPGNREVGAGMDLAALRMDGSEIPIEISLKPLSENALNYVVVAVRDISERKQAQEQLAFNLAKYETLSRVSPVGILLFDAGGKCADVNRRWCEMTGLQRADALGDGWHTAIHPEDRDRVIRQWIAMLQDGQPFYSEHRLRPNNGHTGWVVSQAERITNSLGEVTGYVRTLTDVTEQKITEQALRLLASDLASFGGAAFYEAVAIHLAELVHCEIIAVCTRIPGEPDRLETLALLEDGKIQPNLNYSVAGTPCADVLDRGSCSIPRQVQQQYPDDAFLVDKHIEAYVGVRMIGSTGRQLGHLAAMSRRPLRHPDRVEAILKLFSMSVAAEMERHANERRFSDIFESSPDAIVITNRDGLIVQANWQVATVFGWTPAELVGQSVEVLMPANLRAAHPSLRERYVQSAAPQAMGSGRNDLLGLRKGGTVFPVDISLSPMQTPEGLLVAAAVRDVTERQKVLRELQSTTAELQEAKVFADTVINNVSGLFYVLDQDGVFVRWNESLQELLGLSSDQMGRTHALSIIHEADRERVAGNIAEAFANGHAEAEARLLLMGGVRHFLLNGRRLDIDGKVYLVGSGADFSDRNQAEGEIRLLNQSLEQRVRDRTTELTAANEELIQASRFKSEFLATMSHELRTPLNGILGMNELLLTTELTERQREYIEACSSSGKLLVQLINDILDLSKIESGKLELDPRECSLAVRHDIWDFPREFSPPMIREPSIGHVLRFGITW